MKKYILTLVALLCSTVSYGQKFLTGATFDTYVNNTEYTSCEFGGASYTNFTARLTPYVGVELAQKNRIVFGAELWQDMGGQDTKFLTDVQPILYYAFSSTHADAYAGIFDRSALWGDYSLAIFSDDYAFYNNRLMGLMGRYIGEKGFVEFAISWEGKQSQSVREKFRLISAGEWRYDNLYFGYGVSVLHFAESGEAKGVVDNIIANPMIGYDLGDKFHFNFELGALVAPQCDRIVGEGWEFPVGGVFTCSVERWGVLVENSLYLGDNLQPFYNKVGYGAELYAGDRFYSTTKGVYNRTTVGYENSFFDDLLEIGALMRFQYDGTGLGTQQLITLRVDFEKIF